MLAVGWSGGPLGETPVAGPYQGDVSGGVKPAREM